ncbi:outer membrane beta-barrel family protein [Kaistella yonginensis]|uniref:outer membrane beta-barrel family protein n=1 Tax=Kaistella yonginensis TaxID=658267 RepID=UPI0025B60732|nr:outer membrane beta-barrel family protein [Kaistella yonginensis]MDN3606210.1 outer membrane beta-barrel family protein [Kaistella yonginensis]
MKSILYISTLFCSAIFTAQSKQDTIKQKDIEEVTVIARKPTVESKADRTVFNVANSSILAGNTTWEVLRMTPLVSIDNNDVIKAEGESVTVYVNDRKSVFTGKELKEYLQTIPAENLMKIEVITSPSAKYETSGQVINIVLKKNENEGVKGSATFNNNQSSKNSQYVNSNLNYHKNNFTQNLTGSYRDNTNVYSNDQENFYYATQARSFIYSENTSRYRSPSVSSTSEFELSDKNTIGLIIEYATSKQNQESEVKGRDFIGDEFEKSFIRKQDTNGKYENMGSNLFYKYYDKEKNRIVDLNAGVNYSGSDNENNFVTHFNTTAIPVGGRILGKTQEREYYLKLDYSQPIGTDGSQLEFGGKMNFTNNSIPSDYFLLTSGVLVPDASRSNNFQYTDQLNSLYANFSKTFFKKLETRIGLRFENLSYTIKQDVGDVEMSKNYNTLLPDLLLKYSFSDKFDLSATYNHNIWRPYYSEFNPFLLPSDDGTYYRGNMDLQANPSDRVSLKFGIRKKYFISANYYFSNHDYWTSYVVEDGKTISEPTNFDGRVERYSLNFNTNQSFFKNKLSINLNVSGNYTDNSDFNTRNNLQAKNYISNIGGSSNISYTNLLSKNINLNAWVGYYSQDSGNSVGNKANVFHTFSVTKIFEPLQMEATVRINNIFVKPSSDRTTYAPIGSFRNVSAFDWYGVAFSLVKRFGNQKVKDNTKTNVEKSEGGAK